MQSEFHRKAHKINNNTNKKQPNNHIDMLTKMNQSTFNDNNSDAGAAATSAYTTALLRSLKFAGVQFLRYYTVDACNNIRAKAKPIDRLLRDNESLDNQVSIAEVCYAGLPHYADFMIDGTGMNAKNVLIVQPDLNSFRILPYAKKSAVVFGNSIDQFTNEPSPLCTRSVLGRVVEEAKEKHNVVFVSGIILHYCLLGKM